MTLKEAETGIPSSRSSGAHRTGTLVVQGLRSVEAMAIIRTSVGKAMADKAATVRVSIDRGNSRPEEGEIVRERPPLDSVAGAWSVQRPSSRQQPAAA